MRNPVRVNDVPASGAQPFRQRRFAASDAARERNMCFHESQPGREFNANVLPKKEPFAGIAIARGTTPSLKNRGVGGPHHPLEILSQIPQQMQGHGLFFQ